MSEDMDINPQAGSNPEAQTVKISVEIEMAGKPALRATVQAEGDAQAVQQATAQLSAAIAALVAQIKTQHPAPEDAPPVTVQAIAPVALAVPPKIAPRKTNGAAALWLARYRQRLTLGFGWTLVLAAILVAVVFPPLVPRAQRIEVFMMSLAFGLLGAGALFAGALPGKRDDASAMKPTQSPASVIPFAPRYNALAKAALQKRKPLNAVWGLSFGALFLVAGILAPFVLGQANADDRFLMMIGFAPVAVTGALMMWLFWRMAAGKPAASTPSPNPAPRAPRNNPAVTRAPDQAAFKIGVPVMIGTLMVVLVAVLALVIFGTVWPILNR